MSLDSPGLLLYDGHMPNYRLYIDTNRVYTNEELKKIAGLIEDVVWEEDLDQKSDYVSVTIQYD